MIGLVNRTAEQRINIADIIRKDTDYVMDAVNRWYDKIPDSERLRPLIGDLCAGGLDQTYTPKQIWSEIRSALRYDLTPDQRATNINKLSDASKDLLIEIIAIDYRAKGRR
jgi:hypothetical protein